MTDRQRRLVYFERWMDPVGEDIVEAAPGIEPVRLGFDDPVERIEDALAAAHGYQLQPSTETPEAFYPSRRLIARCPNLLCVSASGAGYDMVDVDACTEAGIAVVNQGGSNAESVAQHVLGMMLVLTKRIQQSDLAMRRPARDWTRMDYVGDELTGRTVGIIGLGNIGRRVAELCSKVFAMRVIAYDPYITEADFKVRHAAPAGFDDVMRTADFVSINCPLTDETRGMLGDAALRLMKPSAVFISTARGGIHDEAALAAALGENRVAGAGLDVFEVEPPPPDHPLLGFDNVVVSPHNAGVTVDSRRNMAAWAAEQWKQIFDGQRPPRLVNPEVWEAYAERFETILGEPVRDA